MPLLSFSVKDILLPGRIQAPIPNETVDELKKDQSTVYIVGDTHGNFVNQLIYAKALNLVEISEETEKNLDNIAQSAFIDQMHRAWRQWQKLLNDFQNIKNFFPEKTLLLDNAKKRYECLKELSRKEIHDFEKACSEITINKDSNKALLGEGDDAADRAYCDWYSIKIALKINMRKIMSNHGLMLLKAWVNNDWSQYESAAGVMRSLNTFNILCRHGIINEEERNDLLKQWAATLDLMLYSKEEDEQEIHVTFYLHAPGRFKRIFDLADFYKIPRPAPADIRLNDLLTIVNTVMLDFKQSLEKFSSEDHDIRIIGRKELEEFVRNASLTSNPTPIYDLLHMLSQKYLKKEYQYDQAILDQLKKNEEKAGKIVNISWTYGHDEPNEHMPPDMIGLESTYCKARAPALITCDIKTHEEKNADGFVQINALIQKNTPDDFVQINLSNEKEEEITEDFEQINGFISEEVSNEVDVIDQVKSFEQMKENILYLDILPDKNYIRFKLRSTQGRAAAGLYDIKGSLLKYNENNPYLCQYYDHYFSGIISYRDDLDSIIKEVREKTKAPFSLFREYQPDAKKIYSVKIAGTTQSFPIYKNNRYIFLNEQPETFSVVTATSPGKNLKFFKNWPDTTIINSDEKPMKSPSMNT